MQEDNHIFQGLRRDNHQIRQDEKFLWNAHNIRLTNRDDSTLLSITNEKGTSNPLSTFTGQYVGHCVLGKYLVIFTADGEDNYIYRVEKGDTNYISSTLYSGNLNISADNPIEALGVYENELVQKVYWIDGKNQPRVINIVADKSREALSPGEPLYPEGSFDFVQELQLEEKITITRGDGSGVFAPGVIQYAFSYYNKYGQESNIFYTSELLNISQQGRGGSPEEVSSNIFNIKIEGIENRFQYLRIYSIHRTSIDAVPTVKIVTDIELSNDVESVNYVDTGRVGTIEDPTKLLYVGGESIVAHTMAQKDGTMFLGNIEMLRHEVPKLIRDSISECNMESSSRTIQLQSKRDSDSLYEYSNQLSEGNTSTFKTGDIYRLGVQFQYKDGKWSEPLMVKDYTIPSLQSNRPTIQNDVLTVPKMSITLDDGTKNMLRANGYKKARALVVLPTIYERMTLAQGVLCPTVFSVKNRVSNTPFAQSSWFFRLMTTSTTENIADGARVQSKHLQPLFSGSSRGAEIQNMQAHTFSEVNTDAKSDTATNVNTFFVDQSILTMHSPDIEFDDSVKQALDNKEFELSIVGLTQFTSNAGDISITTSTPPPAPNDNGFFHKSFLSINSLGVDTGMVAGMFYKSHIIDDDKSGNGVSLSAYKPSDQNWELNWLVYPWHRSGSLNNDCVRSEGNGTRTAELKRKVISNIRVSKDNQWLSSPWSANSKAGITAVSIFDSNEISLIKIPIPYNSGIKAINYYGNVDNLITTDTQYPFWIYPNKGAKLSDIVYSSNPFTKGELLKVGGGVFGDYAEQLKAAKEPVRMKYKSTPHAVFAFNYLDNNSPVILPSVGNLNKVDESIETIIPFWSSITNSETVTINKPAIVQDVRTMSGTPNEIITTIVNRLNGFHINGLESGDFAIMTCSVRPADGNEADLYYYNGNSWGKVRLNENDVDSNVAYKYNNNYWKVHYNGSSYSLYLTTSSEEDVYSIRQGSITPPPSNLNATLFLAELRRKEVPDNMFGGNSPEALRSNLWIPAGKSDTLDNPIEFIYGDTYYQRYDCLKTYSFTNEDQNSVVEIASFMCETRVNIDGRYDRNRGQISNLNMSPINFNLINEVYSQRDNFFNYRVLDDDYYKQDKFSNQIIWSKEKSSGEDIDAWTNITLANTLDMDGERGKVTALKAWNEYLLCFQEKAVSQIMFNSRVQIPASDGVPIEISNGYKVDGSRVLSDSIGCNNKWSIANTNTGLYFIDSNTEGLYLFNGQLTNLSKDRGMDWWVRQRHNKVWSPLSYDSSNGIRTFYDNKYGDIYFTPGPIEGVDQPDALCYSEQLGQFTSLMSYGGTHAMFNFADGFYSLRGTDYNVVLYENNAGPYNNFYGVPREWSFSFISNQNPTLTKIFDTIELRTDHYQIDDSTELLNTCPMNYIEVDNEYQHSSTVNLDNKNMRKKFRVWRGLLPRNVGTRQRIRNPWSMITLGWKPTGFELTGDNTRKAVVHDVSVKYTV